MISFGGILKTNNNLDYLRELWAKINASENFTMKFIDESIGSSLLILPNVEVCKSWYSLCLLYKFTKKGKQKFFSKRLKGLVISLQKKMNYSNF